MANWYCYKDKVEMERGGMTLKYMDLSQNVPCIFCPKCKAAYLLEEVVMTTVKAAESILEGK